MHGKFWVHLTVWISIARQIHCVLVLNTAKRQGVVSCWSQNFSSRNSNFLGRCTVRLLVLSLHRLSGPCLKITSCSQFGVY